MKKKMCMLEENKVCDNCLECNICDLDSNKICDNCAKCIEPGVDYRSILIDNIIDEIEFNENKSNGPKLKKKLRLIETKISR